MLGLGFCFSKLQQDREKQQPLWRSAIQKRLKDNRSSYHHHHPPSFFCNQQLARHLIQPFRGNIIRGNTETHHVLDLKVTGTEDKSVRRRCHGQHEGEGRCYCAGEQQVQRVESKVQGLLFCKDKCTTEDGQNRNIYYQKKRCKEWQFNHELV